MFGRGCILLFMNYFTCFILMFFFYNSFIEWLLFLIIGFNCFCLFIIFLFFFFNFFFKFIIIFVLVIIFIIVNIIFFLFVWSLNIFYRFARCCCCIFLRFFVFPVRFFVIILFFVIVIVLIIFFVIIIIFILVFFVFPRKSTVIFDWLVGKCFFFMLCTNVGSYKIYAAIFTGQFYAEIFAFIDIWKKSLSLVGFQKCDKSPKL